MNVVGAQLASAKSRLGVLGGLHVPLWVKSDKPVIAVGPEYCCGRKYYPKQGQRIS
jgi:hypothetical protein